MDRDKLSAILHLGSKHLTHDAQDSYNESNPGLGLRLPIGNGWSLAAGGYKNSLNKNSFYGGVGKDIYSLGPLGLRLNAGLISGYQDGLLPFLIPEARWKMNNGSELLMQYIPGVKHGNMQTDHTLGFGMSIPLRKTR